MNKFFKKATVVLTIALMVSSMAVSASAVSEKESSCAGGGVQSKTYYVYGNTNTNGCTSNIDVNALLNKFCANNSTMPTDNPASTNDANAAGNSSNEAIAKPSAVSDATDAANCKGSTCVAGNCTTSTCLTGDCAKNNCAISGDCTANNCETISKQCEIVAGDSTSACTANSTLIDRINSAFAKCGLNIKKFSANLSGKTDSAITSSPAPTSSADTQTSTPSDSSVTAENGNADNQSFEAQVATLVNEQRAANGLAPLTLNSELSNVARTKSQDMHDNNYFSHTSPTYGSPFDMLKAFGVSYRTAGENIAMGYTTPEAVVSAWMNSAGHRANILNASYTQLGVGYVADGNYWTQEFIG